MTLYEICNELYGKLYAMIDRTNIKSNGGSQNGTSKLEAEAAREHIEIRPGAGHGWRIKNLNAYCKRPEVIEAIKNFSKYDLIAKR
ncbi:MAG: hypothetical protein QT10_C0013G0005 [archaeon GW2011_AR19]|nr:MAG: hypothetical protein QT10_C0013G0005 [archaeon GW2011_AR19]